MTDKVAYALWVKSVWDEVFVPALREQGVTDLALPADVRICDWGKDYTVTYLTTVAKTRAAALVEAAIEKAQEVAEYRIQERI
jgi:hypothetical protein